MKKVPWFYKGSSKVGQASRARKYCAKRDGERCWYCQSPGDYREMTLEHVVALSRGGTNDLGNLRLACQRCNSRVGNKSPERKTFLRKQILRERRS